MKTSKILLKILVVLVLAIALLIPSTFSWYDHNGNLSGREMSYSRTNLPVSAGAVAIETKKFRMADSTKVYYDQKGNKEYARDEQGVELPAVTNDSIAASNVQYYGTTITNTGKAPAYVNLYLNSFTNSTTAYIGSLQPSLTHKGLSSTVHLTNKNFVRVYFQIKNTNSWNAESANTYLVYKTKSGDSGYRTVDGNINLSNDEDEILQNQATMYFDLPKDTTEFFFATDAHNSGFNTETKTTTISWYRTKTITNVQAETGYYLTGAVDDTTWNAQYATFKIPGGISVKTAFDTLTINNGQHAYVTLNEGTNYTGKNATYAVTSGSGITVDANTGLVTASGLSADAIITTTITGSLGDSTTITTGVSNPSTVPATPIALNVKVPAGTYEGDVCKEPGKTEVVWYIQNSGASSVSFSSIYYTK